MSDDLNAIEGTPAHTIIRLRVAAVNVVKAWAEVQECITEATTPRLAAEVLGLAANDGAQWKRLLRALLATRNAVAALKIEIGK
jgi:hypothetical protein